MADKDEFPLLVSGSVFTCYLQRGSYVGGRWQGSPEGELYAAVCNCGKGVCGNSVDDAVSRLRSSYYAVRENYHLHFQEACSFNIISAIGEEKGWVMGTVKDPDLLSEI